MTKILRLTEEELKNIVNNSAKRLVQEHIDMDKEIRFAQKDVYAMGKYLSSVGLRLSGTEFEPLYQRMKDAVVGLNNALIKKIRGEE